MLFIIIVRIFLNKSYISKSYKYKKRNWLEFWTDWRAMSFTVSVKSIARFNNCLPLPCFVIPIQVVIMKTTIEKAEIYCTYYQQSLVLLDQQRHNFMFCVVYGGQMSIRQSRKHIWCDEFNILGEHYCTKNALEELFYWPSSFI